MLFYRLGNICSNFWWNPRRAISSSLNKGSLAKVLLTESLRKFSGKFAQICKNYDSLRQESLRTFCGKLRKFRENVRKLFCYHPFPNPDPPILAFLDFLASFFCFPIFLAFLAFFLPFPRILGVPRREKPLLLWGKKTLVFFPKKARVGGSGSGPI